MKLLKLLFFSPLCIAEQILLRPEHHDNLTISSALYSELEELARIVDVTYCVGIPGPGVQKPFECLSRCKDFEQFELVTTWDTGPLLSDSCGYIALSHAQGHKRIIVAFRGTYSIASTIADLSTIPQEYDPYPGDEGDDSSPDVPRCNNCTVHMGFHASWANTRDVIFPDIQILRKDYPDYELVLVGHSLGGAVAALAGLELLARGFEPTITTFGEPRLGNQAFADYLDDRFEIPRNGSSRAQFEPSRFRRVTHINDPVPLLPLEEWGYMPHGGEIFISASEVPPSPEEVLHCVGSKDSTCSSGPVERSRWSLPARFRIWELFFAHRDYFWRLGLCIPETRWLWPVKEPE